MAIGHCNLSDAKQVLSVYPTSPWVRGIVVLCLSESAALSPRQSVRVPEDVFLVQPWAALVIGLLSGIVYVFSSKLVSNVLKVDDPLDAAAVHGFCGAWGLIAAAIFASERHLAASYGVEHDNYGMSLLQDVA